MGNTSDKTLVGIQDLRDVIHNIDHVKFARYAKKHIPYGNSQDVESAIQESWTRFVAQLTHDGKMLDVIDNRNATETFEAFLMMILCNVCREARRAKMKQKTIYLSDLSSVEDKDISAIESDRVEKIHKLRAAIEQLHNPLHRELLKRTGKGETRKKKYGEMKLSPSTGDRMLVEAKAELKKQLDSM